jgi:hypothetical protein
VGEWSFKNLPATFSLQLKVRQQASDCEKNPGTLHPIIAYSQGVPASDGIAQDHRCFIDPHKNFLDRDPVRPLFPIQQPIRPGDSLMSDLLS